MMFLILYGSGFVCSPIWQTEAGTATTTANGFGLQYYNIWNEEPDYVEARTGTDFSFSDYPYRVGSLGHLPAGRGSACVQCGSAGERRQASSDSGQGSIVG